MKKFSTARMVLFDSTNAAFKLEVEVQCTRRNPDGSYKDMVYVTEQLSAMLNPNTYLKLAFKTEDGRGALYTSYPQLFRLREAMEVIKGYVVDNSGFIDQDGLLMVRPGADKPVVVSGIGKGNNWVKFTLGINETGENGVNTRVPVVSIEISTTEGNVSVLSVDEFLTVYTIVKDLDLANIQAQVSLAYLQTATSAPRQEYGQYQQPQVYQQPVYAPAPQQVYYQQPQPKQQYTGPRYNTQSGGYRSQRPAPQQVYQQRQAVPQQPVQPVDETPVMAPRPQAPAQQPLQPRVSGVGNLKQAVADTPVMDVNFDDAAALDAIFDN